MTLSDALWPIALAAFLFAGTVKGMIGIGLPTASISVMAQFTDPRLVIALLLVPGLVTNSWQVWRSGQATRLFWRLWPFCLVMAVGIWFFSRFAGQAPVNAMLFASGCVIMIVVVTNLISQPPALPDRYDRPVQCLAGAIAGVMGGLTSIWSPPIIIYLLARRAPQEEFVGASGLLILAGTVPLLVGYWQAGLFTPLLAVHSTIMIFPTLAGFALGEWVRRRMNAQQFRWVFLLAYFFMGANLIRKALI